MRKIKEILRLAALQGLSERQIARGANMRKSTVHDYLLRAASAGLSWEQAQSMTDDELDLLLFPSVVPAESRKSMPDFVHIHKELRRKHVTLQLLWEEYREESPTGYGYSHFCDLYHTYTKTIDLSMRQVHRAGEKLFVDYSGTTASVVDSETGEVRTAEVFIAVLGASNYTYAEATWTQGLADWTGSHVRAFAFLGGVPEVIVPDNLKTGVTKAGYYDPQINPTYQRLAEHYGVAILPARASRPKDKAKVEAGVQLVERWILARLRNRIFFSLTELNAAIAELLEQLNRHPFRKMPGSRTSMFETLDKPLLSPLPEQPFEFAEWKKARVNIDYHVSFHEHLYSVPYQLVRESVDIRATASMIEIYHRGKRVAVHVRSNRKHQHTTVHDHMPAHHQWQAEWTPGRIVEWGRDAGAHVAALFAAIMKSRPHPEQGFRACLGIMRLEKKVGRDRLNAACERALSIGGIGYSCVHTILEHGQEYQSMPADDIGRVIRHENVRGADYYRSSPVEEHHASASHN